VPPSFSSMTNRGGKAQFMKYASFPARSDGKSVRGYESGVAAIVIATMITTPDSSKLSLSKNKGHVICPLKYILQQ